jgi:hypothetical protein
VIHLLIKREGTMGESESEKKPVTHIFEEEELTEDEQITKWRDSAFNAALEKLEKPHGNVETVMQTGEAFGRGLFAQRLKEKSPDWTIKTWLEATEDDVFKPLGTEFTFTKIAQDVATTFIQRDPLRQISKESTIASLFTYGVVRGLFLSAFPKGELLINGKTTIDQPEFIFKTHASIKDRFERERVKRTFTTIKEE